MITQEEKLSSNSELPHTFVEDEYIEGLVKINNLLLDIGFTSLDQNAELFNYVYDTFLPLIDRPHHPANAYESVQEEIENFRLDYTYRQKK